MPAADAAEGRWRAKQRLGSQLILHRTSGQAARFGSRDSEDLEVRGQSMGHGYANVDHDSRGRTPYGIIIDESFARCHARTGSSRTRRLRPRASGILEPGLAPSKWSAHEHSLPATYLPGREVFPSAFLSRLELMLSAPHPTLSISSLSVEPSAEALDRAELFQPATKDGSSGRTTSTA